VILKGVSSSSRVLSHPFQLIELFFTAYLLVILVSVNCVPMNVL